MTKNESLPVIQNSEGASPLARALQGRLLASGGVINTRQLHRHYQPTQGTAGRLNQRLDLPERVRSRYQTSIFQPGAILQRLQRTRRESAQFSQLPTDLISKPISSGSYQSDSGWSRGNEFEQISRLSADSQGKSPESLLQPGRSPIPSVNQPLTPLRVSRQATIAAATSQFSGLSSATQSYLLQGQVAPKSNSESASSTQPETSNSFASVSPISALSGQLRVSRRETMAAAQAQFTPITVGKAHASVQRKPELSSETVQELTLVQTPSLPQPEKNPLLTQAGATAESSSSVSPIQPQVQFKSQPDLPRLKAVIATQAEGRGSLPMVKAQQVKSGLVQAQRMPTTSKALKHSLTKASMPVVKTQFLTSGLVQAQKMPTTAEALKPSSSQGMPSTIIWRKSGGDSSESVANSSQEIGRKPLPLAINQTNSNRAIARQIDTYTGSELPAQTTGSMAEMGTPPASEINVQQLAERVSRILARQLTVERERRGLGRWH